MDDYPIRLELASTNLAPKCVVDMTEGLGSSVTSWVRGEGPPSEGAQNGILVLRFLSPLEPEDVDRFSERSFQEYPRYFGSDCNYRRLLWFWGVASRLWGRGACKRRVQRRTSQRVLRRGPKSAGLRIIPKVRLMRHWRMYHFYCGWCNAIDYQ